MRLQRLAEEAARHLKSLERMQGVLIGFREGEQHGVRPFLFSKVEYGEFLHEDLVRLLSEDHLSRDFWHVDARLWMQNLLQPRQVLALDAGRLGTWSYQLTCIEKLPELEKVIQSGEGALRAWRGQDMSVRHEEMTRLYNRLNQCYQVANLPHGEHVLPFLMYVFDAVEVEDREALKCAVLESQALVHADVLRDPSLIDVLEALAGYCQLGSLGKAPEAYQVGLRAESWEQLLALCQLGVSLKNLEILRTIGRRDESRTWAYLSIWGIAALLGQDDAWRFIQCVLEPLRLTMSENAMLQALGDRFLLDCRALDSGVPIGQVWPDYEGLREGLTGKRQVSQLAHVLERELEQWQESAGVSHCIQWPTHGAFWRLVSEHGSGDELGNEFMGMLMWEACLHVWSECDVEKSALWRCKASCDVVVGVRHLNVPGIARLKQNAIDAVHRIVKRVGYERVNLFWRQIKDAVSKVHWATIADLLTCEHVTERELEIMFRHRFIKADIPESAKQRRRVLDAVSLLDDAGLLSTLELEPESLVRLLHKDGAHYGYQLIVVIKSLAGKLGSGVLNDHLTTLYSTVDVDSSAVGRAFAAWADEAGCVSKYAAMASEYVGLFGGGDDVKLLVARYFYHQDLLGEPLALSRNILKLVEQDEASRLAQVSALEEKLANPELDIPLQEKLQVRLVRLKNGESKGARESRLRRARNLLKSSLDSLMKRSLEHVMDEAWLVILEEMTGVRHDRSVLSKELRTLLLASERDDFNPDLFALFLRVVLGGVNLLDLKGNQAWLRRCVMSQPALECWLAGFHERVHVGEDELTIYTESDLLMAAHMGTLFGTCLSLEHGEHAMSALGHNLEVNKHVVFVKDGAGKVIARKLIAIEKERGELVGYPLYVAESRWNSYELVPLVDSAIMDFAGRCQLTMGNAGSPEQLIEISGDDGSFFLDGVESWSSVRSSLTAFVGDIPGWPTHLNAQLEHVYWSACEQEDWQLLRALAWRQRHPWSRYALAKSCVEGGKEQVRGLEPLLKKRAYYEDLRSAMLNARGFHPLERVRWFVDVLSGGGERWDGLSPLMHAIALDEEQIRELGVQLHAFTHELDMRESWCEEIDYTPPLRPAVMFGVLAFDVLLSICRHSLNYGYRWSSHYSHYTQDVEDELVLMVKLLKLSWVRHGADVSLLSDAVLHEKNPHMLTVLLGLAREVCHSRIRQVLWTRWSARRTSFLPTDVQREMLYALSAQELEDEQIEQLICSAEKLFAGRALLEVRAGISGEATEEVMFRKARRDVVRELERTREECQRDGLNQIRHPKVMKAFQALAALAHDELESELETLAGSCWVEHPNDHREVLSALTKEEPHVKDETWALETMRTIYRGDREVVQACIERYFGDGNVSPHFYWWVLFKDRANELTDEDRYKLATRDWSRSLIYRPIVYLEDVLFWLSRCDDWKGMATRYVAEFGCNFGHGALLERGTEFALLFWRGDERLTWIARQFVMALADTSHMSDMLLFYDFLTIMGGEREGFGACARDMFEMIVKRFGEDDSEHFDALEELCFAAQSWEHCLSVRTIKKLFAVLPECAYDDAWSEFEENVHERAKTSKRGEELVALMKLARWNNR